MARKVQITLEDDLDGGPADETLRFALDGVSYEIDLSEANAARMRATLGEFIAAARSTGSSRSSGGPGSGSSGGSRSGSGSGSGPTRSRATGGGPRRPAIHRTDVQADPATVRAWARAQGISVPQRGRVPADLIARFQAAQPQSSSAQPQSTSAQPQSGQFQTPSTQPQTPPPSHSPFRD